MFTGIVDEVGVVTGTRPGGLTVRGAVTVDGLVNGASICVNGVCLTVTGLKDGEFTVDIVPETVRRTNLGDLRPGSPVNLERPVLANGRLDGHIVQGHVDGTGAVLSIEPENDAIMVAIAAGPDLLRYIVEKGFIAVDGTSLTVVKCHPGYFTVTIIPYTRSHTVVGSRKPGDRVNLEVDILAKYVEKLAAPWLQTQSNRQ
ncbi:MAG: riboflavin synthase [SAR202 cluster bacterium]|nr:riboflavin synthase [SAR202 cluster bacterium]